MDKAALIRQVEEHLRSQIKLFARSASDSADAAANLATPQEKREDARAALEYGALAKGQSQRQQQLQAELEALSKVPLKPLGKRDPVQLGALVEVEDGAEGRTFFLLPVGAGREITGPDGDGVLTVITASSPMGRAVLGKRVGDSFEVQVQGEPREWEITWVG